MKFWNGYQWRESAEQTLPATSVREDGAIIVGPPPDGRSVEAHLDELATIVKRKGKPKPVVDSDLYPTTRKPPIADSEDRPADSEDSDTPGSAPGSEEP
ncbi:MAG: hypothetical protein ACREJC_19140 [Tepidisphaeraceae bacterium]